MSLAINTQIKQKFGFFIGFWKEVKVFRSFLQIFFDQFIKLAKKMSHFFTLTDFQNPGGGNYPHYPSRKTTHVMKQETVCSHPYYGVM